MFDYQQGNMTPYCHSFNSDFPLCIQASRFRCGKCNYFRTELAVKYFSIRLVCSLRSQVVYSMHSYTIIMCCMGCWERQLSKRELTTPGPKMICLKVGLNQWKKKKLCVSLMDATANLADRLIFFLWMSHCVVFLMFNLMKFNCCHKDKTLFFQTRKIFWTNSAIKW